ncbi:MAG TPA: cytochrome b/b6 domain-containing protein [Chitinophagaceae bacterium]|nr:cytochrome b/b6 domain-containing protein [Chitinophagaceae bacterium]
MPNIRKKHPLAIRWMHWINFPILAIMIWSGLMIYWASDVYHIRIGHKVLFHFFPDPFYNALNLPYNLAKGMSYHFVFAWIFMLNGLAYVIYTGVSGEWRYLLPNRSSFRHAWQTVLHDLYIRKDKPASQKYNGAQQIAYTGVILMGIGSLLSGIGIYKPVQHQWAAWIFGGYGTAREVHFILTLGYVMFFLVHVIQVIRTGWNNFQAMVTGFEVYKDHSVSLETVPLPVPSPEPEPDTNQDQNPCADPDPDPKSERND